LETTNPGTGEIKLAICECEITGKKPFSPSRFTSPQEVHEESKKALEHQVGYVTDSVQRISHRC